jgi:hypothetical protein
MKNILLRLKSPVIIIQIMATILGVVIYFMPGIATQLQVIDGAVVAIINLLSGLNNPSSSTSF